MQTESRQPNRNKVNLLVDIAIFGAFLIAMAPQFSGIAIHEWLSIAFGAAIITHLLLHWQWIIEVAWRFFGKTQWISRVNYILNALLFVDVTVIIFTGLMISQAALPLFGIQMPQGGSWRRLHDLSANLALLLTGLHIALHWQWIVSMLKRFLFAPLAPRRRAAQLDMGATSSQKES